MTDLSKAEQKLVDQLAKEFGGGPFASDSTHTMFWNILTDTEKRALARFVLAHTDALILAAYETCAKHRPTLSLAGADEDVQTITCTCGWIAIDPSTETWEEHISRLAPDSARRAMEVREQQIESTTIMRFRKMLDRIGIHGYYSEMQKEFGGNDAADLEHRRTELESKEPRP